MTPEQQNELVELLIENDSREFNRFCTRNSIPVTTCTNQVLAVMSTLLLYRIAQPEEVIERATRYLNSLYVTIHYGNDNKPCAVSSKLWKEPYPIPKALLE